MVLTLSPPLIHVAIRGDIDIATCGAMRGALGAAFGRGPVHLAVDLSGVTFMDVTGVNVLLGARRQAVEAGGSLTLRAPGARVAKLIAILGLEEVLRADQ